MELMKKIFLFCFDKWWKPFIFSIITFVLYILFDEGWWWLLCFICLLVATVFYFIKKKIKALLMVFLLAVYLCLSGVYFIWQSYFLPTPTYQNRTDIEEIIGVNIPKLKIINAQVTHIQEFFEFEITIKSDIEFKSIPDDNFFYTLDSLCKVSSLKNNHYYIRNGNVLSKDDWSKDGNTYIYNKHNLQTGGDDFFEFKVTKGSKRAIVTNGNR